MAKKNTARELLWPDGDSNILVRAVFLYVGQGSSTILLVKDGDGYKVILIDTNLDSENGGLDVPALLTDLLDGQDLDVFVNTHPHNDHLKGLTELSEAVTINEVWHSGHIPGKKHDDAYQELQKVIKKVKDGGGTVVELKGSDEEKTLADASYYILSPAEYVTDDVNDEDQEKRYARIHEQCAVLKFGKGSAWILAAGDAGKSAFKKHITKHHKDRLTASALAASHHGSRSFFKDKEEDDPYMEALDKIDPTEIIVSAPTQKESPFDHPDDDAMKLYDDNVGKDCVYHTGKERHSYIFDIFEDEDCADMVSDDGDLTAAYPIDEDGDDDGGKGKQKEDKGPFVEPKSITGDLTPRKSGCER